MPTASAAPDATSRSAAATSTTRVVADHRHVDGGAHRARAARRSPPPPRAAAARSSSRRRRRRSGRARTRRSRPGPVGAQRAGDLGAGVAVEPLGRQLVGGEAHADREPGPAAVAHGGEHLLGEAQPPGGAVRVRAPVRARGEELRDQVAVRHRDLDAVDRRPRGSGAPRSRSPSISARSSARGQRARLALVARRRARPTARRRARAARRRSARGRRGRAGRRGGAVRVHGVGEPRVAGHDRGQEAAERVRGQQPGRVDRGGLEEDRADAAAGARRVVGAQVVGRQVVVHQPGLVRRRDDAVGERDRPELDRGQELHAGSRAAV